MKKKFFKSNVVSAALILQLIAFFIFIAVSPRISALGPKPEWAFYRVQRGDSIFSIAQTICDPSDRRDPRAIAEEIEKKNKIEGGLIWPDQVIQIPLYDTPEAKRQELREFSKTIKPGQI